MSEQPITDTRLDDCEARVERLERKRWHIDSYPVQEALTVTFLFCCLFVTVLTAGACALVLIHWVLKTWGVVQ